MLIFIYFILGDFYFKKNKNLTDDEQSIISSPDITKIEITKDMEFCIMACDGIWDCIDAQKLCEEISLKLSKVKVDKNNYHINNEINNENLLLSDILADIMDNLLAKDETSNFFY